VCGRWREQEVDQIKHMHAQKEDELVQCHLLERKRLPKILKSDTKTRTMMYRESLRITGGEFSLEEERERMKQVRTYTGVTARRRQSRCNVEFSPIYVRLFFFFRRYLKNQCS